MVFVEVAVAICHARSWIIDFKVCRRQISNSVLLFSFRNPFDVLKTLSQTNQGKSIPLGTLVGQMYQDQGLKGFYRGVSVNVMRACVLNATKMGVYDVAKGKVVDQTGWTRKDPRTAFCSSFVAGFFMTCTVVSSRTSSDVVHSGICFEDSFVLTWRNSVIIH